MVTVVHTYNRFHSSEIRCFVNGKVVSTGETTLVHANEVMLLQELLWLEVVNVDDLDMSLAVRTIIFPKLCIKDSFVLKNFACR